jgi:uroporphyrinogen-III synthase
MTRTEPAATRSAHAWAEAGFDVIIAPLLNVMAAPRPVDVPDDAVLIFTSANGVRHSGLSGDDRLIYCVGDATACEALAHGFTSVVSAKGDWRRLVETIAPTDQPIIHLSGEVVRGQIVQTLQQRGMQAKRQTVYRTVAQTLWPTDVNAVDAVALYSPLAAATLMALPARHLGHLTAYCLSPNVAAALRGIDTRIAVQPNERALIACSQAS